MAILWLNVVNYYIAHSSLDRCRVLTCSKIHHLDIGLPLLTRIHLVIPALTNNYIRHKVPDEITYPFPNFNGCTVEAWEWISNFIPQFPMNVTTYSLQNIYKTIVSKVSAIFFGPRSIKVLKRGIVCLQSLVCLNVACMTHRFVKTFLCQ